MAFGLRRETPTHQGVGGRTRLRVRRTLQLLVVSNALRSSERTPSWHPETHLGLGSPRRAADSEARYIFTTPRPLWLRRRAFPFLLGAL